MKKIIHRLMRSEQGIISLEIALMLPFLLLMFIGMIETTRYILIHQKLDRVAATVADIVAQSQTITTSQMNIIVGSTADLMKPYAFGADGIVMVSSVYKTGTAAPTVRWQYKGGGTLAGATSHIGAVNANATLPSGFTMSDKDNIIIAEVFYTFRPIFTSYVLSNISLYKSAIFRPRLGSLDSLAP